MRRGRLSCLQAVGHTAIRPHNRHKQIIRELRKRLIIGEHHQTGDSTGGVIVQKNQALRVVVQYVFAGVLTKDRKRTQHAQQQHPFHWALLRRLDPPIQSNFADFSSQDVHVCLTTIKLQAPHWCLWGSRLGCPRGGRWGRSTNGNPNACCC